MQEKNQQEQYEVSGKDILGKVQEIIRAGNARRIILKNENGEVLMEIPLTFAILGVAAAPVLAAVGALAGLLSNCTIVVERKK